MNRPAGVILAGGRSSRMGFARKALLQLNGQPLLAHICKRLRTQTDPLLISCGEDTVDFDDFGLELVPDLLPGFRGPLMGLYSALQFLVDRDYKNGLVLCPCDAPFIPANLVQVLLDEGRDKIKPAVAVSYMGVLQPTFSLWQNHHLPLVRDAVVNQGAGGLKQVLFSIPHRVVEWASAEPPPFFNINTPEDLQTAALWLDRMHA
ncbi:MAG TPA: molybdenum cofactor guanylyltransferase [Xanthomonadales bacterium]